MVKNFLLEQDEQDIPDDDCFDYYSEDYSTGKCCRTVNGIPCVFPFKFRGEEFSTCISGERRKHPWCPTEVNSDGVPVLGQWGYCDKTLGFCPMNIPNNKTQPDLLDRSVNSGNSNGTSRELLENLEHSKFWFDISKLNNSKMIF